MNEHPAPAARLDGRSQQLDDLPARATKVVADPRTQRRSVVDDLAAWREQRAFARVAAEHAP